jgi:isoleucyl-tRNA synthetase
MAMFRDVRKDLALPQIEDEVLAQWRDRGIAKKAFAKEGPQDGGVSGKSYVFYEGPPTANGRPGIHHVSARTVKDIYLRYHSMRGYRVLRRGGWDTHGLPVEVEVEKEIGSKGKQDIEAFGIGPFNKRCKESVFRYIQDWNALTERMAFWVDLDRAYFTYDNGYIESEWWILKDFFERGLLFKDFKTTMHCPRCNTSLSSHEVALGMKEDVDDPSVTIKFTLDKAAAVAGGLVGADEARPVHIMSWTTTPWTLPANVACAVKPGETYALVEADAAYGKGETATDLYVVAAVLAAQVFPEDRFRVLKTFPAETLVGLSYAPIMRGQIAEGGDMTRAWTVIADEIVTVEDGTGVVHIATAYGDLEVGQRHGLPVGFSVGLDGNVVNEVHPVGDGFAPGRYAGQFYKQADKNIIKDLGQTGALYRAQRVKHAYPHCWRDDTPLLFYAKSSWYVRTSAVKHKLVSNNNAINWVPDHVRTGRFGRWLENNVDWALSRERYWGCPLPIWESEDGEHHCIGSIKELEELAGRPLTDLDLHRPAVDEVSFVKGGKTFRRVPMTIDCWFDSGAMPYAQWHYPFENHEEFARNFPADYICEAMDQTRGWFYSLHAIATLLTYTGDDKIAPGPLAGRYPDTSSFRNCVVMGLINDAQGRKMSKSRGNTIDPWEVMSDEGCDALRWYIVGTSAPGRSLAFNREDLGAVLRSYFVSLWNCYGFFTLYANLESPDLATPLPVAGRPLVDRWLEAKRNHLIREVTAAYDEYNAFRVVRLMGEFVVRDLSNWYVRRNRNRFWGQTDAEDRRSAFVTLYDALNTAVALMAPIAPYMADHIYLDLATARPGAAESLHLADWPAADAAAIDAQLIADMDLVIRLVELGRSARGSAAIKTRQPLAALHVHLDSDAERDTVSRFAELIKDELNIKDVQLIARGEASEYVSYKLRPNLPVVGRRLGKRIPALKALLDGGTVTAAVVAGILAKRAIELSVDGEAMSFEPDAFLLDVESRSGFATASEGPYLAALDVRLTPALVEEGEIRDVLRHMQDMRKRAGFAVSDRIRIGVTAPDALKGVLERHKARVSRELLCEAFEFVPLPASDHAEDAEVADQPMRVTMARV